VRRKAVELALHGRHERKRSRRAHADPNRDEHQHVAHHHPDHFFPVSPERQADAA